MSELDLVVDVDNLAREGMTVTVEPDAATLAAIAKRFDLPAVAALRAELRLTPIMGSGWVQLDADFEATVTQVCVVSLAPFEAAVAGRFRTLFTSDQEAFEAVAEAEEIGPDEDDVELIEEGRIDLGDVLLQEVALAIDPHPRAPGADIDALEDDGAWRRESGGPFEALRRLKTGGSS